MSLSKVIIIENSSTYFADGRYEARVKVLVVPRSLKFPDGLKLSCVLLDKKHKTIRLILDNHQPYGYHIHSELPQNKNVRIQLNIKTYTEAIQYFFKEVKKVTNDEEK